MTFRSGYLLFMPLLSVLCGRFPSTGSYSWLISWWRKSSQGYWWYRKSFCAPPPAPVCTDQEEANPFILCHISLKIGGRALPTIFLFGCISNLGDQKSCCEPDHQRSKQTLHNYWMIYLPQPPFCLKKQRFRSTAACGKFSQADLGRSPHQDNHHSTLSKAENLVQLR